MSTFSGAKLRVEVICADNGWRLRVLEPGPACGLAAVHLHDMGGSRDWRWVYYPSERRVHAFTPTAWQSLGIPYLEASPESLYQATCVSQEGRAGALTFKVESGAAAPSDAFETQPITGTVCLSDAGPDATEVRPLAEQVAQPPAHPTAPPYVAGGDVDLSGSWYRYKSGSPSTRDAIMLQFDELNPRRGPCQIQSAGPGVIVINCPNAGGEQERFVRSRSQLRPCNQGFLNLCPD